MITTRVLIQTASHNAHVQVDASGLIRVFKYNAVSCDFDLFLQDQQYEASDYMTQPLPNHYYRVTVHGDPEDEIQ